MAKPLRPFVRGGGYYPSKKWIPLVRNGGYTTQNGGETEPVWATASGAIASFTTPFAYPLKKLMAEINPVQDLHGYANPWPAGGGKNKCPFDKLDAVGWAYNCRFYPDRGGQILSALNSLPVGTYTLSFSEKVISVDDVFTSTAATAVTGRVYLFSNGAMFARNDGVDITRQQALNGYTCAPSLTFEITSATVGTFTDLYFYGLGKDSAVEGAPNGKLGTANIWNIQVEAGSSSTAWSPYSNICPISGWTGLSGQRTGFNVWDEETRKGYYSSVTGDFVNDGSSTMANKNPVCVKPSTTYYFKSVAYTLVLFCYDKDMNFISVMSGKTNNTFTTPANCAFVNFCNGYGSGETYNHDISINYPSTDTSYHPYTGEPISVTFPTTVYGGTDEVVSGNGTSTMGMVDLGTLEWVYDLGGGQPYFYSMDINAKPKADQSLLNNAICSQYEQTGYGDVNGNNGKFGINANGKYLKVCDTRYTDSSSFKSAMSGVQLCYELATPTAFTHEGQEVDTLVGQNNVWVTSGDVEVTYRIE